MAKFAEYDPTLIRWGIAHLIHYDQEIQDPPRQPSKLAVNKWELVRLWKVYAQFCARGGFPYGECMKVTGQLEQMGYERVLGWFLLDHPFGAPNYPFKLMVHAWGLDRNQKIIELTAPQFNRGLVKPLRPGVIIVEKGSQLYQRYLEKGTIDYQEHFYSQIPK